MADAYAGFLIQTQMTQIVVLVTIEVCFIVNQYSEAMRAASSNQGGFFAIEVVN